MMKQYRFLTVWEVQSPIERVFDALAHSERWPEWWHGVTRVEDIEPGDEHGVGNVRRYTFRSQLPYDLTFTMRSTLVEPPWRLEGQASGDLVGVGRWVLTESGIGVTVRYEWQVGTTEWWMNLLSPVARPLFAWNHDVIMRWGEEGLRRHLGLPPRIEFKSEARSSGKAAAVATLGAVLGVLWFWRSRRGH